MCGLTEEEHLNLGGYGNRRVKFLGHGIGLQVDGYPVIAEGFNDPLETGMTIALEPKKGLAGIGMAGVEDTFVVTPEGGRCITGGCNDIIEI
jgi:Xaa-Pro aminopeptidase